MSDPGVTNAELPPTEDFEALERLAGALVGAGQVRDAQDHLTRGMLKEGLRRTAGNYTHTARLLGVRRQAVQQMVTRFGLEKWAASLRQDVRML